MQCFFFSGLIKSGCDRQARAHAHPHACEHTQVFAIVIMLMFCICLEASTAVVERLRFARTALLLALKSVLIFAAFLVALVFVTAISLTVFFGQSCQEAHRASLDNRISPALRGTRCVG